MERKQQKAIIYTSPQRSLYIGRLENIVKRVNVSPVFLVSLEGELTLLDAPDKQVYRSRSFLIPAGMDVTIQTHGAMVAQCFMDDYRHDYVRMVPQMRGRVDYGNGAAVHYDVRDEPLMVLNAQKILEKKPTAEFVFRLYDKWNEQARLAQEEVSDARVTKAIRLIKENCDQNISVEEIARQVDLSVSRLVQLFKQTTGTPIRRFRLWHRIFSTAVKLTKGYSLTDAAISSGFADYAQFSRVYRKLGGASPAAAKNNTEIRVFAG